MIYIANQGGLIQYDGVSWRVILIPNKVVFSMARDDAGNFYLGGRGEVGLFSSAPGGNRGVRPRRPHRPRRRYLSLTKHITGSPRDFSLVYSTHRTPEGVYFNTARYLFRWNPGSKRFNHWETENKFHLAFYCRGKFFIRQVNAGLMTVKNDQLEMVRDGGIFADKKIYMMAPFPAPGKTGAMPGEILSEILIGTRSHGFYIYGPNGIRPFTVPPRTFAYLNENLLYHGISLSHAPGSFALATLKGGLAVMDEKGNLVNIFDTGSGLYDNTVYHVFEDRDGNLWLGLSKGIAKIEYSSPISFFNKQNRLTGLVLSVTRHGRPDRPGRLYAGTSNGLSVVVPRVDGNGVFKPVPGVPGQCNSLLSTGDYLLAATTLGVFQVDDRNQPVSVRRITQSLAHSLVRSRKEPRRIWAGTRGGLVSLTLSANGRWNTERVFESVTENISSIVEEPRGGLWLGTGNQGVIHVAFPVSRSIEHAVVKRFNSSHGLPPGETAVTRAAGHLMVTAEDGIYRFDNKNQRFLPDTTLGEKFAGGSRRVFRVVEDAGKHIWIHSKSRNYQAVPQPDGTYEIRSLPFKRMSIKQVNAIYPDENRKLIWFARHDGLFCFDKTVKKNYRTPFPALIREVVIDGEPAFFDNKKHRFKSVPLDDEGKPAVPVIPFKKRNIRFRFGAPFYEDESALMFRFRLEGFDENWSQWTREAKKDYTNIDPGLHRFRVQARNVYGQTGTEAVYRFRVLPPWYKTWWAYTLYGAFFILFVYAIVKWRSLLHQKEKKFLELQVKERTEEVWEKNKQLEEMAKVKSRFFANISHEFRTPLTLIMGPLEQMADETGEPGKKQQYDSMLKNTRRLLALINQLLELSKFESGTMKLLVSRRNVVPFLEGMVSSFKMAAEQKQLDLTFNSEPQDIQLYFDGEKLDKIIGNLLSNALKFTPPGGAVTLETSVKKREETHPHGDVVISVKDTGPGIPSDQIPHIFDRFYRAPGTQGYEGGQKGSGIGLALVKELVCLHYGDINVQSNENGTVFSLELPLGKDHFKPEEIVDMRESFPEPQGVAGTRHTDSYTVYPETVPDEDTGDESGSGDSGKESQRPLILVVEDNKEMRRFIIESLQDQFKVTGAADGQEGMDKSREIIPDLIVSDVMMPRVDGFELCRALKKDVSTSHIPIILLTAKASDENIIQGLETGADDYITKPFNAKVLSARVKNLIELRRQQHKRIDNDMVLQPAAINVSSVDENFLKELRDIIEKNLSDSLFSVEQMANKLYMSRATLYRKVMALTGQSPTQFIRSYRLKRAAQLFDANFGNVSQVAMEVGFTNLAHFSRCFKEAFHRSPSAYLSAKAV